MVAFHLCEECRGVPFFGIPREPNHCYGAADRPAPPGVFGGYRCSCECRNWQDEDVAEADYA